MKKGCVIFISLLLAAFIASSALGQVSLTDKKVMGEGVKPLSGEISLIDASGLEYFINTNTAATGSTASGAANEASYTQAVVTTTSMGGTTTSTLTDAYDDFGALVVNGTHYTNNGTATFECNGRQLVFNPQVIGNLTVYRKVFVPSNDEFIRWINIITNNGSGTETVNVETDNNLGSDDDTCIVTTSSGDANATVADTWVTTNCDYDDPRLAHVLCGPGAPVGLNSIDFTSEVNNPTWSYSFNLGAGETGIIMFFDSGQPTKADAQAAAEYLVNLPANAVQCMTDEEKSQVLNFVVAPAAAAAIPTVGHFGIIIMGLVLGASGFWMIRKRRRT